MDVMATIRAALGWPHKRRDTGRVDKADMSAVVGFGYKTAWIAVACDDSARVIDGLDLQEVVECQWSKGLAGTNNGGVCVTPPIDGWVLVVVGLDFAPETQAKIDRIRDILCHLSTLFGAAHFYASYRVVGFVAWARAEAGIIQNAVSFCDELGGFVWLEGRPTKEEVACGLDYEGADADTYSQTCLDNLEMWDADEPPFELTEDTVIAFCGRWSVDPTVLEDRQTISRVMWSGCWPSN